jgi:hypothetical protein
VASVADHEPLVVSWRGQHIRVRHDDPRLGPYSPAGSVIRCAVELASDVRGLQLVLDATVGDRYSVRVVERPEGVAIGLRRLSTKPAVSANE